MSYSRISAVPMLTLGIMLATGTVVRAQSVNSSRNDGDSSRHERACSDRTLFGDYGAKLEGTVLGPNPPIPVRTLVLFRFDGHGGLISVGHAVVNGVPPAEEWGEDPGVYSINPDCTGSAEISQTPGSIRFHFVAVNKGRQFYLVTDRNAISGEARKVD